MEPRGKDGEKIPEDEEESPDSAPIYDDDLTYDDWYEWDEFLQEVGVIDIKDGMIEYETGDNSRLFVMLAEMGQSNPYLKTDEESQQANEIMEVFFNGVLSPLKISTQSQRVEMTDFLNELKEQSQYLPGTNDQMREYAEQVIEDTLNYQQATDRFENKAYLQFQATVTPDEVYGDTPLIIEQQIHEKAMEKLVRQIDRADSILRRADHPLAPLDTFGLYEVLYKTFNRESSVKIRLEDVVKRQRYTLFTGAHQNDVSFKRVQQMIHNETEAIEIARKSLYKQTQQENAEKLKNGEDYYSSVQSHHDEDDFDYSAFDDLH
ncbi:hypothetical protein [Limosilactobacillus mucosae]|uniref:Uncharacterized protein n=1 Tax=Limosilactobacillus mucosae TaxID=97478 RepID=A0AAJ1HPY0_LIMMU|nr:hypothetical protein [Limosilactobacillus mucosae]MDC2828518.1 hypothetical protein [Limosilactobacillus mucosae]MDC2834530.1 hypothetical protein [Limosilactobacillus mucosae]